MATPSGIVNGSGFYGKDALEERPAATIIVPTVLQMAADAVDSFTHLTCFYNKYWHDREDMMTLPICFFYVKRMQEILSAQTSEQRLILYEPQQKMALSAKDLANSTREGAMQVVVDNVVRQPKTYQMEIVLPFLPVSPQYVRGVNDIVQLIGGLIQSFGGDDTTYADTFAGATAVLKTASQIADLAAKFPGTDDANFINKNSLEAMFDSQKIVCMKMWSGYQYKYVLITGCTIEKQPKEDGVFRATAQLKEMPVLSITPPKDATAPSNIKRNWAAAAIRFVQGALLYPALKLTGVEAEAGKLANNVPGVAGI
jgi:hypothetical protein